MSLDDLEALARECIGHEHSLPPGWIASDVHHLARALLDVLSELRELRDEVERLKRKTT